MWPHCVSWEGPISRITRRRALGVSAGLAAAVTTVSACGGGKSATKPAPPASQPVATQAPTTTTAPPVYPLTGLPVTNAANASRPALSVKIDNISSARPQTGLNGADLVTVELVEGGLTRIFATYQSQDVSTIGPIRSARPVDADLLHELNGGIFAYSGAAQGEIAPVIDHGGAVRLSDDAGDPGFHRDRSRRAPDNLYGSMADLYTAGLKRGHPGPPGQLFTYSAQPPAGGTPVGGASLVYSNFSSDAWHYDAPSGRWSRVQDGTPDVTTDAGQVTTSNIVVLQVAIHGTGIFDQAHNEDPLPVVTGTGTGWVLRDGQMFQVGWSRPTYNDTMKLTLPSGEVMPLHTGSTWLELLPVPHSPTPTP